MQLRKLTYFGRMTAGIASWLRLVLLLLYVSVSGVLLADSWENTQYNTTEGNEFYITTMKHAGASSGDREDLKVYLYATARNKTNIRIVSSDGGFSHLLSIPENGQAGLDIPLQYVYADCNNDIRDEVNSESGKFEISKPQDKSLHVYTCDENGTLDLTHKVSLYITSFHKEFGYEATNVLPIRSLERAYMVQNYHTDKGGTEFAIIATEKNQCFEINLKLSEYGEDFKVSKSGIDTIYQKTISADKGQVCLIRASSSAYSLAGTSICSKANFAVVNGNQFTTIPKSTEKLNHIFEQSISADKWGREYIVTPTKGHIVDYVLLTALENNTRIFKDGALLATINQGETYTDVIKQINSDIVPYYTANNQFLCYLYETSSEIDEHYDNRIKWGRPTMTSIAPINLGVNSIIVASFNVTSGDLNLNNFPEVKDHFINIVTESKYKDKIYIDKNRINGFKAVPGNPKYSYCLYQIPAYKKPHLIECIDSCGTFTARMYGHSDKHSYAYSAGFRVNRKVDMLLNDQYLDTLEICKEEEVKLTSIIGFDYESIDWSIKSRDAGNCEQFTDSIIKYNFTTDSTKTTIYDVQLAVTSKMPDICDECQSCDPMYLRDTVSAIVIVKNSVNEYDSQNVCLNDAFSATAYGGTKVYNYIADTTIWQSQPYKNEKVKLKVNTIFEVRDTLRRTNGCDSIIIQRFIVRLPDTTSLDTSICDNQLPFVWKYNEGRNSMTIDTIKGKELVIKREVAYNNKYGCPSMATLNLHVYPTHKKVDNVVICQEPKGNKYKWNGHEGHIVYDVKNNKRINANDIPADIQGTYTYIDSLKTGCNDCPKCDSIHILNLIVHPTYFASQDTVLSNEDKIEWENLLIAGKNAGAINPDYIVTKDTIIQVIYDSKNQCDSILQLNISFGEVFRDTTYGAACDNDKVYEWYWDNNGKKQYLKDVEVPSVASVYEFTEKRKSSIGVDSLFYLYLTVNPTYYMETVASICEGNQYIWKVKDANGDSVKITDPIFDEQNNKLISPLDIPTILADNNDSPQTFRYTYHLKTVACATCPPEGCDSVYSLVLTILPQYDRTETLAMCDNDSIQWNGEWFYGYKSGHVSSIKSDTLITREYQNDHGCLSYKRLQLILYPSYLDVAPTDTTYKHICENEKYETSYGKVYNANGEWDTPDGVVSRYVVIDTIETKACASCYDTDLKCDSVVASVVYVYPTYQYVTYDVICQNDNYQWVVRDQNGDSINVIRDNIYDAEDRLVNGIPTDQHGQFEYRYYTKTCEECSNSVRCDSTHILYLTILPRANTVETLWMCDNDSVYWDRTDKWFYGDKVPNASGVTYTSQKDPYCIVVPASNAYGCDYEQILYLYVRPSYVIDSIVHICDNQVFMLNENIFYYGDQYKADGLAAGEYHYTHTFKTTDCSECADKGCDSIINLTLFVHKTYSYVQNDTVCKDDANYYSWQIIDPLNGNTTILSGMIRDEKNQADISASNIPTNELGTFTYTYKTLTETCEDCPNSGCDSIWTLQLTVIDGYAIHREIHMCDNDTAVWNNQLYVGQQFTGTYDPTQYKIVKQISSAISSYDYYDTIPGTSKYGCDSTHFLKLRVHPTYLQPVRVDTIDRCDNETYLFYGTEYNTTGEWHTGKDTTQFITLSHTDTTINGCDSAVVHVLRVHPTFNNPVVYDTICHSALPYNYPDTHATSLQGLMQSGVYTHTLKTQHGCDSIITLDLTVNPSTTHQVSVTWCQSAGPYTYDSIETPKLCDLTQSGVYTDTLQTIKNQYGCDSIIELHLTILETIVTHLYDSICDNQLPYNHWDTRADNLLNLTHTGVYRDTLTSELTGCDSVLVLHLQVNKTYNTTDTITICASEGSPYIWRPSDMNGSREIAIPFEIDDRVNVKDKQTLVLNDSSVLLQSIHGCDSLVNLRLIVHPTYELVEVDTVDCQDTHNKYSTWIDQLGGVHQIDISEAGWITIAENPGTIYGCDSIIGIKLYVRPTYRYDSVYTICQDERISWQGKTYAGSHYGYNYQMLSDGKYAEHRDSVYYLYEPGDSILAAGVHHDTIVYQTILGCDSTFYLTLNVLPTSNTILDVSVCDSEGEYVFKTSDKNGTYYDTIPIFPITEMIDSVRKDTAFHMRQRTLKTPDGCDSTVYLHLTVTPTYEYITRAEICKNDTFIWRENGYNKAGIYYDRRITEQGCDSNFILELFVRPVLYIPKTLHACDNQTVMHSDTLWYDPDSVRFAVETFLLWKPGMEIPKPDDKPREVHYYTLDGRCDSIIYQYYLHIHPTYDSIANATICSNESYQLHDSFIYTPAVAYHEPGSNPAVIDTLITDKLKTVTCEECEGKGCDSIFSANIRILPAYKHVDSVTICSNEKYDWQDTVLYEPQGDTTITYSYQKSYTTKLGCDSIYELHLTVHLAYDQEVHDTICADEYYLFGDTLLNQTGEYLDTLRTIHDCDSIVHLYLTVLDTTIVITYDTICVTEKYRFFDAIYTEPGSYDTITLNDWGCKQYNYLYLEVIDTTAYNISIGNVLCADDEELLVEYEWLSGRRLIEYSVFFDEFGHSQGFEDIIHAPLDPTLSYFTVPIPRGEDLPMPPHAYFDSSQGVNSFVNETKQNYPEPNRYTMRVVMHNGICGDSLQRKDTTISFWYPSWIHEQHWNDVIVLYKDTFNGGYEFSKYQWYQNGKPLPGATGQYLYLPEQLLMNQRGDCSNYYQVELTRINDGYTTMTCPICPVLMKDTIVPNDTYFSVVPTAVPKANPIIHFLSSHAGEYQIISAAGNLLTSGKFVPDANNYAGNVDLKPFINATNTILLVKMILETGEQRSIKVRIGN